VNLPVHIAEFLYRFRHAFVIAVFAGAAFLLPRVDLTQIDNDLSAWISKRDPEYQTYERFRQEFGGTRTLIVALESDRIFTPEGLQFIERITSDLERIELVERVQSLASANIVRPLPETADEDGGIEVSPLVKARTVSEQEAKAVRRDALNEPLLRGDLVNEDGTVTAVVVTFDESRIDEVRGRVIDQVKAAVENAKPDGFQAHYNGSLEISETYNRVTVANTYELTPPILILTVVALYALFRSIRKTVIVLIAVLVSVVWTLGLYSLLGFNFNVLTSMLAPLVVVLAIADDVHILQHFDHEVRKAGDKRQAFISSVTYLFAPLLSASGTTALGMLSLATSNVVAVRTFGIGAGIGVMVDFLISIVFVPALLTFVRPDPKPAPQERWLVQPLQRAGRFAYAHPRLVMTVVVALVAGAVVGATHLRVDTNHINFFPKTHPLSQSAAVIDRELSGIYSFNILLEGPPESLKTPDAMQRMERLSRDLERLPYVRKVVSAATYVKRVNQQLSGGSLDAYRVPDSAGAIAQELFVFGLSEQGRFELARIVASDFSRAHISVKLASMSSDLVFEQIHEAERLAAAAFDGSGIAPTVTGSGRIFSTLDHYLVTSQLTSFGTAFLTVFGVIFLVFRSARFGVLGIIANVFPVILVLGIMGWLDISLNIATVMVASVTLGIVDDDTIHFISRYRREVARGAETHDAVETAAMQEGRAALTTTIINALGYTVLMASEYRPTAWFGSLLATTMLLAFIAEVFIVPAVISLAPRIYASPAIARRLGTAA
jgi:predicted RND superfamily exporter protein